LVTRLLIRMVIHFNTPFVIRLVMQLVTPFVIRLVIQLVTPFVIRLVIQLVIHLGWSFIRLILLSGWFRLYILKTFQRLT